MVCSVHQYKNDEVRDCEWMDCWPKRPTPSTLYPKCEHAHKLGLEYISLTLTLYAWSSCNLEFWRILQIFHWSWKLCLSSVYRIDSYLSCLMHISYPAGPHTHTLFRIRTRIFSKLYQRDLVIQRQPKTGKGRREKNPYSWKETD